MSLVPIPGQPIKMNPKSTTNPLIPMDDIVDAICKDCSVLPDSCFKFMAYDRLFLQMKNVPTPMITDDCFMSETFMYSGIDKVDWQGTDNFGHNNVTNTFDCSAGSNSTLTINDPPFSPVSGTTYKFVLTFDNISGGSLEVRYGATVLGTISSDGTYIFSVTAPNNVDVLNFYTDTSFAGRFVGFEYFTVLSDWEFPAERWIPDFDKCCFCCEPGDGSVELVPPFELVATGSTYYKIQFRITGMTSGSVYFEGVSATITNATGESMSYFSNGIYTIYAFPSATTKFRFVASDDFDGCICGLEIGEQCRNNRAYIVDGDGAIVADISINLTYNLDWMTLSGFSTAYSSANLIPGNCYTICIVSMCSGDGGYIQQNNLLTDPDFDGGLWTTNGGASISAGILNMPVGGKATLSTANISSGDILSKCWAMQMKMVVNTPGNILIAVNGNTIASGPVSASGVLVIDGLDFTVSPTSVFSIEAPGCDIEIEYVYFSVDPACADTETFDFCSDCMQYLGVEDLESASQPNCTVQVVAAMEASEPGTFRPWDDDWYLEKNMLVAHGFLWVPGNFYISFREQIAIVPAKYPGDSDGYRYANGNDKRTSARLGKTWDVCVPFVNREIHDSIALINKLDWVKFRSVEIIDNQHFYVGMEREYAPAWPTAVKSDVAQSKFTIERKNSGVTFSHNLI